jgi:hypothetical protein
MNEETILIQKSFTDDQTHAEKDDDNHRIIDLFKEDELIPGAKNKMEFLPEHLYRKYRQEFQEKNGLIIVTI